MVNREEQYGSVTLRISIGLACADTDWTMVHRTTAFF
jgi:hypothetical protein